MNTDMNQYLICKKCVGKTADSKTFLRNCALGFVFRFSLLSTALSLPGYGLLLSVQIDTFRCEQMSTQTNLLYLGLVNVTMITGTHCS